MLQKIELTPLHKLCARKLFEAGAFYFKQEAILQAFQFEENPTIKKGALEAMLELNKHLKALKCDLMKIGYEVRNPAGVEAYKKNNDIPLQFQFTYSVQSKIHNNAPLIIDRVFELQVPTVALPNFLANDWLLASAEIPYDIIKEVSKGN